MKSGTDMIMHLTIFGCMMLYRHVKIKLGQKYYGISRNSEFKPECRHINHLQFLALCMFLMKRLGLKLCFTCTVC